MATADKSKVLVRADQPPRGTAPIIVPRASGLPIFWIIGIVLLVAANVYGWQITRIDLPGMVRDAPKLGRFVTALTSPDVFTQDQSRVQITLDFLGVDAANPAATPVSTQLKTQPHLFQPEAAEGEQDQGVITGSTELNLSLKVDPGELAPNQAATVTGSGFQAGGEGVVVWQHFGNFPKELAHFKADAQGNFTAQILAPNDASQVSGGVKLGAVVSNGVGSPRLSKTFIEIVQKTIETIFLALVGTTFGVVFSIPISFLAARNIMTHGLVGTSVYYFARVLLNLLRSIEVLILAVIFVAWLGLGPFPGVLALTVHAIASLGKLYSEAIESIDSGPIEAITATGANRLQVIVYAVVPQVVPQFLAFTLYRWDINVRMSTVLGLVGGGGIGYLLIQYINLLAWPQAATAIWVIAVVVIGLDLLSARVRHAVI